MSDKLKDKLVVFVKQLWLHKEGLMAAFSAIYIIVSNAGKLAGLW
jgi:hypothetical protein